MFGTCFCHISTPYSERQTLLVFPLCAHYGWSSHLMNRLLQMMRLSWLEMHFWFKGSMRRYWSDHVCYSSSPFYPSIFLVCCISYCSIVTEALYFPWTSELSIYQYICLEKNLGMTLEPELELRGVLPTSWRFRKRVSLLSKGLEQSYPGEIVSDEVPLRWLMILTPWYVVDLTLILLCMCYNSKPHHCLHGHVVFFSLASHLFVLKFIFRSFIYYVD